MARQPALESLRVFEACVRHANFTRAAAELGVTPAAVSLRIRDLEADLGTKLFRRSGPKIEPTEAGAALAARISPALDRVRAAVDEFRAATGPLRITAVPTFATRWLTPRLPAYHMRPDAVPLVLDVSVDFRAKGEFDVAVRTGLGGWPGLEAIPLMPLEATPMLSPALAAAAKLSEPGDLAALPLIQHDDWPRWFREAGCGALPLRFYADAYATHDLNASAAVEGAGVALLSPTIFAPLLREGRLIQPFPHVMLGPSWHYTLLNSGEARPAVRGFCAWLEEAANVCGMARPQARPLAAPACGEAKLRQ